MSRTRYYPVSQSFLNDAETWEMRDQFGDRSIFMWMSLLSSGEMDEGNIHGTPAYIARIHGQYLDRTHPERAQKVLVYMALKGWLTPLLKDGLTVGYFITNYWKYHKRRNPVREASTGQFGTVPNLSEPSEPSLLKNKRATQYPDGFQVSDEVKAWAIKERLPDPSTELQAFKDYHTSKGSTFKDWNAALRTWLRNGKRFNGNGKPELPRSQVPYYKPAPNEKRADPEIQAGLKKLRNELEEKMGKV